MKLKFARSLLMVLLSARCFGASPVASVEFLDQGTGVTVGILPKPIMCFEAGWFDLLSPDKQPGVIYFGPVEWDRSGHSTYGLWIQTGPGVGGRRIDDLRAPGAVQIKLDDGVLVLSAINSPVLATSAYAPVAPVGQIAYFGIDVATLKRIAATKKFVLNLRATDLTIIDYVPVRETRGALEQFLRERVMGLN